MRAMAHIRDTNAGRMESLHEARWHRDAGSRVHENDVIPSLGRRRK